MKKKQKEKIIKKWEDSGLLDELCKMNENTKISKLLEPNLTQKIK